MRATLQSKFIIVEEENITQRVRQALEIDSERREALIKRRAPRFLHKGLKNFASTKGSQVYDLFSTGEMQYVRFVLEKAD